MPRKRLLWQLFPSYLLITVLSLLAVTWYSSRALRSFYLQETERDLQARAILLQRQFATPSVLERPAVTDSLCKVLGERTDTRITVIDNTGLVLGDSDEEPERMDNHATRPEFIPALEGGIGSSIRSSKTLLTELMYVAVPLFWQGEQVGAVRAAVPTNAINQILSEIQNQIVIAGGIVALIAGIVGLWVANRISQPLVELKRGAERFARGEFKRKLPIPNSEEIGALAEAMNRMAAELDDRIRTVLRQRNEQEAVLASMVEGVVAVDTEERLINFNQAAATLMLFDPAVSVGQHLTSAIPNKDLHDLITNIFDQQQPVEGEIVVQDDGEERYLMANGSILRDPQRGQIGALVVLNDVTRLRRLERVRQEFVANVSHELKTPVTSIKGFVETLLDGPGGDPDRRRFLEIIARQADRLNAIIEDLLNLSRIEQDVESRKIVREHQPLRDILTHAIQACEVAAGAKDIDVTLTCNASLSAPVNAALLEQAVINLVDNAIKYSDEGQTVQVRASLAEWDVVISVIDNGRGIEPEHLPRLFERFYRVDKARSRQMGGTGLGLAIVKHIIRAHNGRITVESQPNKGTRFDMHLPLTPEEVPPLEV
ncbi:HAMP domain-containing protein [candidate division GN15 bacterium]|nr:HAMP domain-containing protein [candidate division GN15 bacterium]